MTRQPVNRYRITLRCMGLWLAVVQGNKAYDFVPGIRAYGLSSDQAIRRAVRKADRHTGSPRSVLIDPDDFR